MSIHLQPRDLIAWITDNLWVRFFLALVSAIIAYLDLRNAGLTHWFWIFCSVTLFAVLWSAVPLLLRWNQERRKLNDEEQRYYEFKHKIETLTGLIDDFAALEKSKSLDEKIRDKAVIRVLAILPVENKLGVILNIGKEEELKVGTQLLVYRTDIHTSDGQHIEQLVSRIEVTYVQTENNCSQAVVKEQLDRDFWNQMVTRLKEEKRISPPNNFVVPFISKELDTLSIKDIAAFRKYLEIIRDHLNPDRIMPKEAPR